VAAHDLAGGVENRRRRFSRKRKSTVTSRADGAGADAEMTLSYPANDLKPGSRGSLSTTQASSDGTYRFDCVFPDAYRLSGQNCGRQTRRWFSGPHSD
jgi:hypothetical protein